MSIFKSPYVSGNPSPLSTVISSSNAYVNYFRRGGFSGMELFGAGTVCFSTREMSATVEIFFNNEVWSLK